MYATLAAGVFVVVLCSLYRHSRWIIPIWLLFTLVTGAHTVLVILSLFAGLTDFAAMGVMFLAMLSWPVTATFVALLFARPRKRKVETHAT